jgi:antitoxin component YwqK of YwqJK toxin-antitoxin module
MKTWILYITAALLFSAASFGQGGSALNQTDQKGRKQGHWIKLNPDQTLVYDGWFRDNQPVGEFRRYYENNKLKSLLVFKNNGREADATLFYPNGYTASKGTYINQKKEGKWKFFSEELKDCLISEEIFSGDLRNGPAIRYFRDSTIAEKLVFVNDMKQGEWTKYYPDGVLMQRSSYVNGKIDGRFESWYEDGKIQFSGQYRNDARDGVWLLYNPDGSLKYRIEYKDGMTDDRRMDLEGAKMLEEMDKNAANVQDPEKTKVVK